MQRRLNKEYDPKNIEYATKMATLSPDFHTIWNYKREIIEDMLGKQDNESNYKFLCVELLAIIK